MRALFAGLRKQHRPGVYECNVDPSGIRHVTRSDELELHMTSAECRCHPTVQSVVDDNTREFLCWMIIHRRMRNSRSLYQPWELGH